MSDLVALLARHSGAIGMHLVISTVLVLSLVAAAAWLPRLTARTRHAILVTALVPLVMPSAVFAWLLERLAGRPIPGVRLIPLRDGGEIAKITGAAGSFPWMGAALLASLAITALLLVRWWLLTRRLVAAALQRATPPPPRAIEALNVVRRRLSLRRSVDLVVSPLAEAPAALRIIRPVIVLPHDACASLDDAELESLLCHECAHVARRDNLIGVLEAVVCSLFWFHPAVWLLHGSIARTREAACDELVADTEAHAATYAGTLAKFCGALIAPRVAGVSCMATSHLKERMEHLMSYPTLRSRALPHRTVSFAATVLVVLLIGGVGALDAAPGSAAGDGPYTLNYSVQRPDASSLLFRIQVVDTATGRVISEPIVRTVLGQPASMRTEDGSGSEATRIVVEMKSRPDASGTVQLTVRRGEETIQTVTREFGPQEIQSEPQEPLYSGEPISLNVSNADIRDVLKSLGELTQMQFDVAPEVRATVTIDARNEPWDSVLARMLRENDLVYEIEAGRIHITPIRRSGP